ncbi:hypothetical protein DRE_02959 [Drechslerella stenobrocha 248]|uniref:DNA (cytosine-5-)-methyltransferase n=1 Tax=Drechslerella stenobrocha 248 TaxID=1043628 RepID=W7HW55_9PEZI|nr:hypothetical protein DRE_02959 [Drechslerella stenobrocha 248]
MALKRGRSEPIDVSGEQAGVAAFDTTDIEIVDVVPSHENTPRKRRCADIQAARLPENLTIVPDLTLFKPSTEGRWEELRLHVGCCVELADEARLIEDTKVYRTGYLLRVSQIKTSNEGQYVSGPLFRRARNLYGIFDRTCGEVVWLKDAVTVDAIHIVRTRELVLTNHIDRTCGGILPIEDACYDRAGDNIGRLVCRRRAWIADNAENDSGSARMILGDKGYIRLLRESEADEGFRVSPREHKLAWMMQRDENILDERLRIQDAVIDLTLPSTSDRHRESVTFQTKRQTSIKQRFVSNTFHVETLQTATSFSSQRILRTHAVTNNRQNDFHQPPQRPPKQYTFGDVFCGGGGASCGARQAGLKIVYGIDNSKIAIDTYAANYGAAKAIQTNVCDFAAGRSSIMLSPSRLHCDILHVSPPCQYFSPVHTRAGRDDEKNEAASFSIGPLLDVVRPRVVTMEQTFGLLGTCKFRDHFTAIFNQLVSRNYSVRWEEADATDYGAASARKRLIMIAACPGEDVTPFPIPTSFNPFRANNGGNVRRLPTTPTVKQVLDSIPRNAENHRFDYYTEPKIPTLALHGPFNKTITCGGGEKVHPSGLRPFTVRELAAFQTFPTDYKFGNVSNTDITKMIGNAWPPKFAQSIFEAVVEQLKKLDRQELAYATSHRGNL